MSWPHGRAGKIMLAALGVPNCCGHVVAEADGGLVPPVARRRRGGHCPGCGWPGRAGRSCYRRRPADLPSLGRLVRLDLAARRLRCVNAACPRRTFAEPVPSLVTSRVRPARASAMPASASTVLRLPHAAPVPRTGRPCAVGKEDWAWRKGRSYGTILVDLEWWPPLDLLPDRSGSAIATWLRRRPEITVVGRDRSIEHAEAVMEAVPGAPQVADRWHLLLNMAPGRRALADPLVWPPGAPARARRRSPTRPAPAYPQPASPAAVADGEAGERS